MLNARTWKLSARETLPEDHKKIALIHAGLALGVSFLISLLSFYLNGQMGTTGGLSGLGMRSILTTAQMVLQYAVNIAMPFWEAGFAYAALRMARGERAGISDLLEGFRRFGPVLRLKLITGLLFMGVAMVSAYIGVFAFSATPLSRPFIDRIMPAVETATTVEEAQAAVAAIPTAELMEMFAPFLLITGVVFLVLAASLFYKFRLAEFVMMDQPGVGAMLALTGSSRITKGHRFQLFRLDLSFWWFYLLLGVSAVAMYADVILLYMGVPLPISSDAAWILASLAGCLIQLVVYWQFNSQMKTAYAEAYYALRDQFVKQQQALQVLPEEENREEF